MDLNKKLWTAVLVEAIKDLTTDNDYYPAKKWFLSSSEEPKSFRWICSYLGIPADLTVKTILSNHTEIIERIKNQGKLDESCQ